MLSFSRCHVCSTSFMLTLAAGFQAANRGEVLKMTWDEISFDAATWTIPKERMKMGREHAVPLSDAALAILRDQHEARGKNPHVFPGRPQRPLSAMAMSMLLKRMKVDATVHGMRSSFRMWAADVAHAPFEVAEQCLAHVTGNAVVQAYQRSSMLERRRPIMTAWADFVTGKDASNVVPLRAAHSVIKIAISIEAFEAMARTLPLDSVSYENEANEQGERYVWLEPAVVNRLGAMRGPGESYSDAILRLVADSPCR